MLAFDFVEGGPFTAADNENGRLVAVISETTREHFFDGRPAVGKTMEADGQSFRVVGVVRDVPVLRYASSADLWVPVTSAKTSGYKQEWLGDFSALILARRRADLPQVKAEFQSRLRGAEKQIPDPKDVQDLVSRRGYAVRRGRPALPPRPAGDGSPGYRLRVVLLALMLGFMLLPTINLVNINLSRILDRASEIGVRRAFGASSRTLMGQFLIENLVLTLIGAASASCSPSGCCGLQRQRPDRARRAADQLPDLPLWPRDRRLLRPVLGRLSGLADVEAPPRPSSSREVRMIRHLFKLVWNRKRSNALMILETCVSFLVVFAVVTLGLFFLDNYRRPLGFEWKNVLNVRVGMDRAGAPAALPSRRRCSTRLVREVRSLGRWRPRPARR